MSVFRLLESTGDDPREDQLRHEVGQRAHRFPGAAPGRYVGDPGGEMDAVAAQLREISRIDGAAEAARAELPALQADALLEERQCRGKWLLLSLLVILVTLVLVGVFSL